MPITPAQFIARFPEFAGVDTSMIQNVIDDAVFFLRDYQYNTAYVILQFYLTAHMLYVQQQAAAGDGSSSSPINSKHVGDVSSSSTNAAGLDSIETMLTSTSYGQQFWIYYRQARLRILPYTVF